MIHNDHKTKILLLIAGDIIILYTALVWGLTLRYFPDPGWFIIHQHIFPFSLIFVAWIFSFGAFGLYDLRFIKNNKIFLYRLLRSMLINTIFAIIILYFFLAFFTIEPRTNLLIITAVTTILLIGWRYLFNLVVIRTPSSRLIFFGTTKEMIEMADYLLKNPQLGQKPIAFVINNQEQQTLPLNLPYHSLNSQNLASVIKNTKADTVVVYHSLKENTSLVKMLFQVLPLGVVITEFAKLHEKITGKIPLSLIGEVWFLENLVLAKNIFFEFLKRALDILLSILAGFFLVILLPFISLGIAISTPGDVFNHQKIRARKGDGIIFFSQKRVGKNGKIFDFIKFRSQRLGAEKMSEAKEIRDDPRQYSFGKFMRTIYIDELPQIWNVLKGEMSFIGPRPERPEYVEQLKQQIPFYEMRLLVQPGITGWAQVNMENDASVEDAPEKMQYDLYYIKNRSFKLDLLIILRTVSTLLKRKGR